MHARRHHPVAALVVLGVTLLAGCGDDGTATTPSSTTTTVAPTTSTTSPDPSPTTAEPGAPAPADAEGAMAVVDAWLATIPTGDGEQVLAGLGPLSLTAVEAMGGIDALMPGLSEGMAAFAQPGLERSAVPVPGNGGSWLVTYAGEVEAEGTTSWNAHSWLVTRGEGPPRVETFSTPPPELLAPADPTAARPDEMVTVTLPAGGEVVAVLDGTTLLPGSLVEGIDGDQVQVSAALEDGLPSGKHVITVAVVPQTGAAGPWATTAVPFEVG